MAAENSPLIGHRFTTSSGQVVVIFTDSHKVIQSIQNGSALQPVIAAGEAKVKHQQEAIKITSPSQVPGVVLQRDAQGVMRPIVSDKAQRDMQLFVPSVEPWFEGCAELRAEYNAELAVMEAKGDCKGCEKGELIKKYLHKLAKLDTTPTLGL